MWCNNHGITMTNYSHFNSLSVFQMAYSGRVTDYMLDQFKMVSECQKLGLQSYVELKGSDTTAFVIINNMPYNLICSKGKVYLESIQLNMVVRTYFNWNTISHVLKDLQDPEPHKMSLGKMTVKKLEACALWCDSRMKLLLSEIDERMTNLGTFYNSLPSDCKKVFDDKTGLLKEGRITKNGIEFSFEVTDLKYYTSIRLDTGSSTLETFLALSDNQYKK
jgi:hypothetical protein